MRTIEPRPIKDKRNIKLMKFKRALAKARESAHISQKDVAEALGVHQTAVSHLESFERGVKLTTLSRYLKAMGASATLEIKTPDGRVHRLSLDL